MSNHFVIGIGKIRLVAKNFRLKNGVRPSFVIGGNYCVCYGIKLLNGDGEIGIGVQNIEFSVVTNAMEKFSMESPFKLMSGPDVIAIGRLKKVSYVSDKGWPSA